MACSQFWSTRGFGNCHLDIGTGTARLPAFWRRPPLDAMGIFGLSPLFEIMPSSREMGTLATFSGPTSLTSRQPSSHVDALTSRTRVPRLESRGRTSPYHQCHRHQLSSTADGDEPREGGVRATSPRMDPDEALHTDDHHSQVTTGHHRALALRAHHLPSHGDSVSIAGVEGWC